MTKPVTEPTSRADRPGLLTRIKRKVFDERGITHQQYRPLIYWTYLLNPLKKTGRVSFPEVDELAGLIRELPGRREEFELKRSDLEAFMAEHIHHYFTYFSTGYGKAFVGKAAEHFMSLEIAGFTGGRFVDIAASLSPFSKIVKSLYPAAEVFCQDLVYEEGIHGDRIGGNAGDLPLDDGSVRFMTLHNSIEHFEGSADTEFIRECGRVLEKGGEAVILPIFVRDEHLNYVNPGFNPSGLQLDDNTKVIYNDHPVRFMRHYSPESLNERILLPAAGRLETTWYLVRTSPDFEEDIELGLALKLTKL